MVLNILIDLVIGSIPIAGDVFDFLFEENVMNLRILLRHRDASQPPRGLARIGGAAIIVVVVILAFALLVISALLAVAIWIVHRH